MKRAAAAIAAIAIGTAAVTSPSIGATTWKEIVAGLERSAKGTVLGMTRWPVEASKPTYYVDADTFELNVHPFAGWTFPVRVRVMNANAPEKKGECSRESELSALATKLTKELLSTPGAKIELSSLGGFDRYDRYLATVTVNGSDLGEELVDAGLARPWTEKYEGQTKQFWCQS